MKTLTVLIFSLVSITAFAHGDDGSAYPACANVTPKCMAADVTGTTKKGKTVKGYQPGMHGRDGEGLWMDCVEKLAHNQQVPGVTGVSASDAQACMKARHDAHKKG